jgi:protein-arginine kinase activator protein McsA
MSDSPNILHIELTNQSVYSWIKQNRYIIFSEIVRYSSKMIEDDIKVIQAIIVSNSYDNIVFITKKENIKNSLEKAMDYFLEIEEYEKCSEIRDLLNKL